MTEPCYIAQTCEPMTADKRIEWWQRRSIEGSARHNAGFFRMSTHDTIPHLTLLEGWIEHPGEQGEPRWQMESQK